MIAIPIPGRFKRYFTPMDRADGVLMQIHSLPLRGFADISEGRPFAVLAPHPDDEVIGCGGILALSAQQGCDAHVIVLTDGSASHPGSTSHPPARLAQVRQQEARSGLTALGLDPRQITFLGLQDGAAPRRGTSFDTAVRLVADVLVARNIAALCATWEHDPHPDHEAAALIARAACAKTGVKLLTYPVWGLRLPHGQWLPRKNVAGFRVDVARLLPLKREALSRHASQMSDLITDSSHAFQLDAAALDALMPPFETFLTD